MIVSRVCSARLPAAYISTAPSWVYSGSSMPKLNIASYAARTDSCQLCAAAEGGQHRGEHLRRAAVERRQQRLFLVREVLVEGALRGRRRARPPRPPWSPGSPSRRRSPPAPAAPARRGWRPPGARRRAAPPGPGGAAPAAARGAAGRRATTARSAAPAPGSSSCFVAVEALVDHLLEAADHRPDHLRRHVLAAGDLLEEVGAEPLEGVERPLDHRDALGAGGVDLDEAHLRGRRAGRRPA